MGRLSDIVYKRTGCIIDQVVSEQKAEEQYARREERLNSKEFQEEFSGRLITQTFAQLQKKHFKELDDLTAQNCTATFDLIMEQTRLSDDKNFQEVSFEDIAKIMHRHAVLLEVLKKNSDQVMGQKRYGYYENMFKALIAEDVRFLAFAPAEIFNMTASNLRVCTTKLIAVGKDEFDAMLDTMSDKIRKNEAFRKNYLKIFKTAKEQLSHADNAEV